MARKPRLHVPGGFYHVILRGNGGQDIFFAKGDRTRFALLLQEGTERFRFRLHAFCLMTNHAHLLIQVSDKSLAKIIQNLSFRYTRFINKRKKRIGHLFQGRYKAFLIDADTYLVELVRYIHNNPIRAGIVKEAAEYPWSSHRVYLGKENLPFLTADWVLSQFGEKLAESRKQFDAFVAKTKQEPRREDFYGGEGDSRVLGDDAFLDKVLNREVQMEVPSLQKIIKSVCKYYQIKESELRSFSRVRRLSEARGVVGWFTVELGAGTLTEVADYFGRDLATLSRIVTNIVKQARTSRNQKNLLEKIRQSITAK